MYVGSAWQNTGLLPFRSFYTALSQIFFLTWLSFTFLLSRLHSQHLFPSPIFLTSGHAGCAIPFSFPGAEEPLAQFCSTQQPPITRGYEMFSELINFFSLLQQQHFQCSKVTRTTQELAEIDFSSLQGALANGRQ